MHGPLFSSSYFGHKSFNRGQESRCVIRSPQHKMSTYRGTDTRAWHLHNFRSHFANLIHTCVLALLTATAIAQPVSQELFQGLKWRLIGPFRGGRAVAAAGVPG